MGYGNAKDADAKAMREWAAAKRQQAAGEDEPDLFDPDDLADYQATDFGDESGEPTMDATERRVLDEVVAYLDLPPGPEADDIARRSLTFAARMLNVRVREGIVQPVTEALQTLAGRLNDALTRRE